ncbi:hypothetical protein ALI144C_07850 [Actinosynnema sp. ALI-1.44]|uniref:hypothetical protein n=1 Tax=Actinosynnema sp. ALI-1.44 TaxID=1933779 RepID=UPI00097BCA76|nr:hypothetical protein [Actinosynnema sp. ALI-1.44]ONI87847.1 hypothetical protein ALI144C_07850 [Actinosynnema sp. ALI-1.44]
MADEFFLDPNGFQRFTNGLDDAGTDLGNAYRKLSDVLTQFKGCWGDDEIGKGFQKNYYKDAEDLREGAGKLSKGLVETAANASQKGKSMAELDEESARILDAYKGPEKQ